MSRVVQEYYLRFRIAFVRRLGCVALPGTLCFIVYLGLAWWCGSDVVGRLFPESSDKAILVKVTDTQTEIVLPNGCDCDHRAECPACEAPSPCRDKGFPGALSADIVALLSVSLLAASIGMSARLFEAKIISKHYSNYAGAHTAHALRSLIELRRKNPAVFATHRTPYDNEPRGMIVPHPDFKWCQSVDDARRSIKFYFFDAIDMYTCGQISRSSFIKLIDQSAICVFFEVVEPLEAMLNPLYDYQRYYNLMLLCGDVYNRHNVYDNAVNNNRIINDK